MGVITKPSSVQRSVIVWLLVACGMAAGCGGATPSGRLAGQYTADTASCPAQHALGRFLEPSARAAHDGYRYTAPVGSSEGGKSPYGAYDMTGRPLPWLRPWYLLPGQSSMCAVGRS